MKKNLCIMLCLIATLGQAAAQNNKAKPIHDPVNPQKDKLLYNGYTICLQPAIGQGYGFDIIQGGNLVVHQEYNPFTMDRNGLGRKEDAFRLAKWQVDQLNNEKQSLMKDTTRQTVDSGKKQPLQKVPSINRGHKTKGEPSINRPLPRSVAKEELQIQLN